jgi:Predicted amidophosphoribosyltransferases
MISIKTYASHLISLFYPNLCVGCGQTLVGNEQMICVVCLSQLPKTNIQDKQDNLVEQRLWGRLAFQYATSMYFFTKGGIMQKIIHALKYQSMTEIGELLGYRMGLMLKNNSWIQEIDMIIPVPLSKKRMYERGYNQTSFITKAISETLHIAHDESAVIRKKNTESQTHKSRIERTNNLADAFEIIKPDMLQNKHILLVDDVLTTGATIESIGNKILKITGCKISVATLACAME